MVVEVVYSLLEVEWTQIQVVVEVVMPQPPSLVEEEQVVIQLVHENVAADGTQQCKGGRTRILQGVQTEEV